MTTPTHRQRPQQFATCDAGTLVREVLARKDLIRNPALRNRGATNRSLAGTRKEPVMATGNANPLRVTGLKIGNAEWMIDGAEGKSIREICDHFKIKRDGHNFFVNGVPASGGSKAGNGDVVERVPAAKAGN